MIPLKYARALALSLNSGSGLSDNQFGRGTRWLIRGLLSDRLRDCQRIRRYDRQKMDSHSQIL